MLLDMMIEPAGDKHSKVGPNSPAEEVDDKAVERLPEPSEGEDNGQQSLEIDSEPSK